MKKPPLQIKDDFLTKDELDPILTLAANVHWEFDGATTYGTTDTLEHCASDNDIWDFQFVKLILHNSMVKDEAWMHALYPIFNKLQCRSLMRIKLNLNPYQPEIHEYPMHLDQGWCKNDDIKVAIFYLNTCDGYTKLDDGTKVTSVGNRIMVMSGDIMHCGTNPTDVKARYVLNINYF